MIVVLVCLIVSGMLLASLLQTALLQDRQLVYVQYRSQTAWIADAGLERALGRLALAPEYEGETWNIDSDYFGGSDSAVVVIRVEKEEIRPSRRRIVVEAVFPSEGPQQARLTRRVTVNTSQES
jgi:hypothetical protein